MNHIDILREAIEPLDTPMRRMAYLSGNFPMAKRVKDLNMRYRWDLFYDVRPGRLVDLTDFHDDQVDDILRAIVPDLDKSIASNDT